jgi:hypothetical protein
MKTVIALPVVLALTLTALPLAGCETTHKTRVSTATTGQELTDLKAALDEGVISKSEYDRKREEILHH